MQSCIDILEENNYHSSFFQSLYKNLVVFFGKQRQAIHHRHTKSYYYANEESIQTKLLEHSVYWQQPIQSHHAMLPW